MDRIYQSGENSPAIQVYQYLHYRANKDRQCFPGHRLIARDLKRSVSTVKRKLAELEQAGFIRREERHRDNSGQTSNLYTIIESYD